MTILSIILGLLGLLGIPLLISLVYALSGLKKKIRSKIKAKRKHNK